VTFTSTEWPAAPKISGSTTLIFLRHGRALEVDGCCIGQTDVALSREGANAIEQFASDWRNRTVGSVVRALTAIHSSDLRRVRDSAHVMGAVWGLPVQHDPRLREMHFGAWDGQRWAAIAASDGGRLRAWTERWIEIAPPGGEGIAQIERRAEDWLDGIIAGRGESARTLVVVSHAGWIRVMLSRLLGRSISRMFDIPVDYARATILSVEARGTRVIGSSLERVPSTMSGQNSVSALEMPNDVD
jgi:alpha-ribazole phosphatase